MIGTASKRNEEYLRELGVDEVINYRDQRFETAVDSVDVVIDAVGGEVLERSGAVLDDGGVLVTLPGDPPAELVQEFRADHGVETQWFSVAPNAPVLVEITELIDTGQIQPTISDVYPLTEAQAAHKESEAGHVRGKLVLDTTISES